MNLARSADILEILFIALFALSCIFYLTRTFRVARMLNSHAGKTVFKCILRLLYFSLLLIALLGPSIGEFKKEIKSIGKDIYLLIDLSQSMNAFDIQPSRLEKVKFELRKIVKAFHSDRIGLILFSSDAFLQCPLTYDHNALLLFIETLSTNIVSNTGTDFAPALKMALKKHEGGDNPTAKQQSKIIVLVSDGEDFGSETVRSAEQVKANEIKLFTLGIGTRKGGKIPYRYGFKTDKNGKQIVSTLNDKALKNLSGITDGKYFEISTRTNDIERMITAIKQIEGELRSVKEVDTQADKYYYFLFCALGLILVDVIFTVRVINI